MQIVCTHVFAAICVICSHIAIAQEYPFIKYTPKDGLVSSRVQNFFQDSKGRIFFMTGDGLSVYDGARFLNYTVNEGLPNPVINDVLEITPDSILVATNTGVLNAWVRGTIKTIKVRNGFCPVINKFYRNNDRVIYVVTDQGLFRLDKDIFVRLPITYKNDLFVRPLDQIDEIGNYLLLKAAHGRNMPHALALVHKESLAISSLLTNVHASSILPIPAEKIILAVINFKLVSFDLDSARQGIFRQKELPVRYSVFRPYSLSKVFVDRDKNMWAIAASAILCGSPDGTIQSFDKTNGLNSTSVFSLGIDRENILWILTEGSGVLKLVSKNVQTFAGRIGISPAVITAIYSDDIGNVWMFNAEDSGMYCHNKNGVKKWEMDSSVSVNNISKRKGSLLLFNDNGICEAMPSKEMERLSVREIYHRRNDSVNFSRAVTDSDGNIYIPGSMITVITTSGRVFTRGLGEFIDQITFDRQQRLWTVTRNGELFCFEKQFRSPGDPLLLIFHDKLNIRDPRSITVDKEGVVWIGTRFSGIYRLEYKGTKLASQRHWSTKEMLTDNFIYYLTCDNNNVIWAGTQSGIDKINSFGTVESVTRNNNIYQIIHQIQFGVNDEVWALGPGGVVRIKDERPGISDYIPQLQIVRMATGDKIIGLLSEKTVLPSQTRQVTIDVAATSFIDEKRIAYSYRLDGNEQGEWSFTRAHASIHLINLQPGDYKLHIKAFFPISKYKTADLIHQFSILPPWWKTWWFRLLLAGATVTAFALLTRFYYQKKLKSQKINFEKQSAIELERTRIAMEMHDDLGSGLTSIRYLATGLTTSVSSLVRERAIKIESSAKQLVDSMNDIIWTLKSDNNKLSETLNYIRKQAGELLESVGIDYELEFPREVDEMKLTNEQKRNLILISKEAVHNAIKHSNATTFRIIAFRDKKNLQLIFSDNGSGFKNSEGNFTGYGLLNMQKRASEIGATIQIVHEPGTTITLVMKLI